MIISWWNYLILSVCSQKFIYSEKNENVKFLRADGKQKKQGFLNFYNENWFFLFYSRLLLDSADWALFNKIILNEFIMRNILFDIFLLSWIFQLG